MNILRPLTLALLACACWHSAAQAQVLRCEDANGNVTYTNTGCAHSKEVIQVVPPISAQERAQQDAQYQQALQRKQAEQLQHAERDAARQQADAARAAAQAAQRPATVLEPAPASDPARYVPIYVPRPPHARPPHARPPLPMPHPPQQALNCNVFRCYDGKGNTWSRP